MQPPSDLEKLLAKKYAEQLGDLTTTALVQSEARNVLNKDLDALGLFNQAMLMVQRRWHTASASSALA
ncbi:MAG: hypothetical protein U0003_00705 [Vampirovibrionales bacterium]